MAAKSPKILFYVQHLLGIGHVKRASLLVKAWLRAGFKVTVVSGGEVVEGFEFGDASVVQLPAIKAVDASFSSLVDEQGQPLSDAFKSSRKQLLLDTLTDYQPDILVVENYPFGRRQLRWELDPLLELAHKQSRQPLVVASVRDILQARTPTRRKETLDKITRYFHLVMVHGDENFIPLSTSFPEAEQIKDKLAYTGYVCGDNIDESSDSGSDGTDEVIVSAGGGAVGYRLMEAVLAARLDTSLQHLKWRFLIGPNLPNEELSSLQQGADEGVIFEPVRGDFPQLLRQCRLSISQAGYNTVMDLLTAECPSVLVPFEGVGETEQLCRTERLQQLGFCTLLRERDLTVESMIEAIEQGAMLTGMVNNQYKKKINLDGADRSAEQIYQYWKQFNGGDSSV